MTQKFKSVKEVFDVTCAHVKFDRHLYLQACQLQEGFVNKKQEHISFFGGSLTGVDIVRFTDADRDKLFDLMLQADEDHLRELIANVRHPNGESTINQDFKIASDVFNIACIWLIHSFHHSTHLSAEERHDAKVRVCLYLMYRFLTSLLFHYFKYATSKEIAQATYDKLNNKYTLKQEGSWGAALTKIAEGLMGPDSKPFRDKIDKLADDYEIVLMLNDMQSRVKDMLKNIYKVFMNVHANGERVSTNSTFQDVEGELELKDQTKSVGKYTDYLKRIISDQPAFIVDGLVDVVANIVHTMSPRLLYQTLAWSSDNYKGEHDSVITAAIDLVMEHAIDYLHQQGISYHRVEDVLTALRGTYMSSRSTDARLLKAREDVEKLVQLATQSRNSNAVASVRTGWMLYIVARAYTMRHFANA
jgi:hypothetical protein